MPTATNSLFVNMDAVNYFSQHFHTLGLWQRALEHLVIEQSKAQNKGREIIGKTPDVAAVASAL